MKYIWEPEDIIPGRIICDEHGKHIKMIGFHIPSMKDCPEFDDIKKYHLISFTEDGMIGPSYTKESLADLLAGSGRIPISVMAPEYTNDNKSSGNLFETLKIFKSFK